MNLIAASVAIVCALTALEKLWPARQEPGDHWLNIQAWVVGVGLRVSALPLVATGTMLLADWAELQLLDVSRWPFAWGFLTYFLVMDLLEYNFHRLQHAWPMLWRMHSLHHSDPSVNATTAERHFWCEGLIKALTIWPMAALLLHPSPKILVFYAIISFYNYFLHANIPISFGPLSWLLNSPAYHRLHHSRDAAHFGANFAAILPIWDLISGAYRRPAGAVETGLASQPQTFFDVISWPLRFQPQEAPPKVAA